MSEYRRNVLIVAGLCLICFAAGRYSAPGSSVSEKHSEAIQQDNSDQIEVEDVTEVVHADGSKETHSQITKASSRQVSSIAVASEKTVEQKSDPVFVSALVGLNSYGLSVSRPILGPIVLGAWGLSNGSVGFAVGIAL